MIISKLIRGFHGWLDSSGHTSSDTNWSQNYIYDHMLKYRAKYIDAKLRANMDPAYENYRIVPCMPVVRVPENECPCAPKDGCSFRKAKYRLIRTIHISSLTSMKGEIKYDYIQWDRFANKLDHNLEAMSNEPYYTRKNIGDETFIYLHNDNHKRFIALTMIPYDPIEYALMPDCNGRVNECLDAYDVEFPMDPELESTLFEETFNSLVPIRPKETDTFNNAIKDIPNLPLK